MVHWILALFCGVCISYLDIDEAPQMERLRVCTCLKEENERWHQLDSGQHYCSSVKCHRSYHSQMSLHHLSPLFFSPAARPQAAILQRKEGTFDAATNSAKIRPNQPLRRFEPKSFFVGNHIGSTITVATTASPTLHRYPFSTSSKSLLQCIPTRAKKKASKGLAWVKNVGFRP